MDDRTIARARLAHTSKSGTVGGCQLKACFSAIPRAAKHPRHRATLAHPHITRYFSHQIRAVGISNARCLQLASKLASRISLHLHFTQISSLLRGNLAIGHAMSGPGDKTLRRLVCPAVEPKCIMLARCNFNCKITNII